MSKRNTAAAAALASLVAVGMSTVATNAAAAEMEKCYGVVKAGNNDCQTATSACAGTSTADGQKDAWLLVPKGMCARLVGGNTEAG
ncbi:MAG: DUF2282 domain-containing protein [Pseudomonadota bacterium]